MSASEINIGSVVYFVREHLYYDNRRRTSPLIEYCVCSASVKRIYKIGKREFFKVVGLNPNGFMTPHDFRISDIGKKCFFTFAEASRLASELTSAYEGKWGWAGECDAHLRRPWEEPTCNERK